jgi:hypothetical protein
MWQHHVAAPCGSTMWQHHVAAPCGSTMWQHHVAAHPTKQRQPVRNRQTSPAYYKDVTCCTDSGLKADPLAACCAVCRQLLSFTAYSACQVTRCLRNRC